MCADLFLEGADDAADTAARAEQDGRDHRVVEAAEAALLVHLARARHEARQLALAHLRVCVFVCEEQEAAAEGKAMAAQTVSARRLSGYAYSPKSGTRHGNAGAAAADAASASVCRPMTRSLAAATKKEGKRSCAHK